MTWIKLDDKAPRHPKIENLSDRGFRWWIRGLCYASEFLTDGQLPPTFFRTVPARAKDELGKAGIWITGQDGVVRIHDYLDHQVSRKDVDEERIRNRDRARKARAGVPEPSVEGLPQREYRGTTVADKDTDTDQDGSANADPPRARRHAPGPLAGSLPRDHVDHGFCGARFCVKANHVNELIRRYGTNGEREIPVWLTALDDSLGPQDSPGGWVWILQQFDAYLTRIGRLKPPPNAAPNQRRSEVPDADETRRMIEERERKARG